MASKFRNAGQTCVCADRFLVHAAVHDEFVARLAAASEALVVGHGLDAGTQIGPLVSEEAAARARARLEDAVARGAELVAGGRVGDGLGRGLGPTFAEPTVLTRATPAMAVWSEENFAPIVAVARFETEAEALALANDSEVGLAGYFASADYERAWRFAERLEVGDGRRERVSLRRG